MRAVSLGPMPPNATLAQKVDWCVASIRVLADASRFEGSTIADPITITNAPNPPVSAFDPTTATLPQVANCLATVLRDMQRRGRQNRAS